MELILLLVLLGLSAAFSGSETAFFSLGQAELARLERSSPVGRQVTGLLRRATDLLSGLLIGNLLINTAASVVATSLSMRLWGPQGLVVAIPAITLALLLFGEITPKMLALRFRRQTAVAGQRPLRFWLWVTRPALRIIGALVTGLLNLLPFERTGSRPLTNAELQLACDLAVEEGTLTGTEGRSLGRLLLLGDLEVCQVMTPRTAVITLRREATLRQVLGTARRAGFNRYPVLDQDDGQPVGFFHLKDLLLPGVDRHHPLRGELRPLFYVPESKDVGALLTVMRRDTIHLAGVVDEHGDFTGIVTMADCLQALLGPVMDSTSGGDQAIPLGDGRWVIGARMNLRELKETTGLDLPPSKDYVTVAGFLMAELGRVLQPGDRVTLPGARITVLEMTGLRANTLQVTLLHEGRPVGDDNGGAS